MEFTIYHFIFLLILYRHIAINNFQRTLRMFVYLHWKADRKLKREIVDSFPFHPLKSWLNQYHNTIWKELSILKIFIFSKHFDHKNSIKIHKRECFRTKFIYAAYYRQYHKSNNTLNKTLLKYKIRKPFSLINRPI